MDRELQVHGKAEGSEGLWNELGQSSWARPLAVHPDGIMLTLPWRVSTYTGFVTRTASKCRVACVPGTIWKLLSSTLQEVLTLR